MRMLYMPVCLATLYIIINTGFIFENHIKPTPYTIGTKYSPKLNTSTIFLKTASIFLHIRHKDKPSLTTSRSTIKSPFIHLLILSGQVELNPTIKSPFIHLLLVLQLSGQVELNPTIKSPFIHLLLVLLLSGQVELNPTIKSPFIHLPLVLLQVELNPGPNTPNQSSTFSTNYPCGICQKKSERQSPCAPV